MATTLRNLCQYAKEDYGMNLICGEKNMNNLVNWVHMIEDPEAASFLHGQELIFTTGIGFDDTDWLIDFVKGLVKNQAAGLVMNLGPYIPSVPKELVAYCEEVQFPVLTIPWSTRIVDMTNDFCRKIIKAEENEVTVATAFRNAIFSPEKVVEYRAVLERKGYEMDSEYCVVAMALDVPALDKLIEFEKVVKLHLNKILFLHSERFNIFRQDRFLIVVLQSFPVEAIENAFLRLQEITNYKDDRYHVHIGIGINDRGISSLPRNYKRSLAVLGLAERQEKPVVMYRNIGFYQLLLEVEDPKVLRGYYNKSLGLLEAYDIKNDTDYVATLKIYLELNASVQEVAKATFVHRNTINYKIKKIKEILETELTMEDCLKLLMAFKIKELQ